jgi:hypothetical protein
MGFFNRLFGKKPVADSDASIPFMEHPTGHFKSAVDAMADAIKRLRALPEWNDWITFCAQGMGHDEDSEQHAEIRMRRDEIQLDDSIDAELVTRHAGVPQSRLTALGANHSVGQASPAEAARIMDAIFRNHLGIRPFPDQHDDYAVGAEW